MKKILLISIISLHLLVSCKNNETILKKDINSEKSDNIIKKNSVIDETIYGFLPDDSVNNTTEDSITTKKSYKNGEIKLNYLTTVGHLVTLDPNNSKPNAKMFYVAFTAEKKPSQKRPVTFIYDGGPGTTSMYQLLGGFSPKVIKSSYPNFTPPGGYSLEDNPDSLLEKTDLIYINAIGTAYSTAIAPFKNRNFWGADEDAQSFVNFIKRYLTKNKRWDSPKFLMGLSYGTVRSPILVYFLHKNGIDFNGITSISTILDYRNWMNPIGQLPSFSAAALNYQKIQINDTNNVFDHLKKVEDFSSNEYASFMDGWNDNYKNLNNLIYHNTDTILQSLLNEKIKIAKNYHNLIELLKLSSPAEIELANKIETALSKMSEMPDRIANKVEKYIGINSLDIKKQTKFDLNILPLNLFNFLPSHLLENENKFISFYDARNSRFSNPIVDNIDYLFQDPLMNNTNSVFNAAWFLYIQKELKYSTNSNFIPQNMYLIDLWNYSHTYPSGKETKLQGDLYVGEDLAAALNLNPNLKFFQAGGIYDFITPYYQATLDLKNLPLVNEVKANIEIHNYSSGHLMFLDLNTRAKMKKDLEKFYEKAIYR
ncbi:hypothetical protein QEJ31_14385 [Pigmentibacter sp. JX0631]|uniref:S10 family serine carboxypeptidase-like protein n=1 Tax=Pigmentibacter sp. JX0631 TaxID=2976982 RepID=UPI0024689270|nr:hypothetical protein [Pigmentibacter sp. JX0631]WGL59717.1 hypothetical protein QEJ31_14385 [Pigmentibacter sp. JX0631]